MRAATTTPVQVKNQEVASDAQPDIFRLRPDSARDGSPVTVHTSSAPLSAREEKALDKLAMLFTIQEERCLGEVRAEKEASHLSKASLTSSQMAAEASFIYQHIDFQVLAKCVPGFVKSHLNKNARYLPETFILRVNYWRRRRALGDETSIKKNKREKVVRACAEQNNPSPRASTARTPRSLPPTARQGTI